MGNAELLEKLQALPPEKQLEVFDFIEFLSERCRASTGAKPVPGGEIPAEEKRAEFSGPLATLRAQVANEYGDMEPLKREELYDRVVLSRQPPSEDEIKWIMENVCGAWGHRTVEETDALIKRQRIADWGEEEEIP